MKRLLATLCLIASLVGCASVPKDISSTAAAPAPKTTLRELTHADLDAAAKYADDHGYPARAGMWRAIKTQLTAAEAQVAACKAAIAAGLPKRTVDVPGPLTLIEIAAEHVAQGVSADVRANCEPIPLPLHLLPIPKM